MAVTEQPSLKPKPKGGLPGKAKPTPRPPREQKVLEALQLYEQRDTALKEELLGQYQQGENAAYAGLGRTRDEDAGAIDHSMISRGLYNTTLRDVAQVRNDEATDQGRLQIARGRADLLNRMRPDPTVYGPLISEVEASNTLSGDTFSAPDGRTYPLADLGQRFDAMDANAVEQMRGAFYGGPESAYGRLRSDVNEAKGRIPGGLYARGLGGAGVRESLERRTDERGGMSGAALAGAASDATQAARPNPGLYGPLLQQMAYDSAPKGGNALSGPLLGLAGAVIGGFAGSPGTGYSIGSSLGSQAGDRRTGPGFAGQQISQGFQPQGYGSSGGGGGYYGTFHNGSAGAPPVRGGYGSYGDYPTPTYGGTPGAIEIPGRSRYGGSYA